MIHFRERAGRVRRMSAAEFRRTFGARYAPRLIAPEPAEAAPGLPGAAPAEAARLRRALAAGRTAPVCVADAGPGVGYGFFARRAAQSAGSPTDTGSSASTASA